MAENGYLGVHVIAGPVGESIVLELPDGEWGVVDCFSYDQTRPQENPTLCFLEEFAGNPAILEFACLTHPHYDHLNGFLQLLQEYPYPGKLRSVWLPIAREPKEVVDAIRDGIEAFPEDALLKGGRRGKLIDGILNVLDGMTETYKGALRRGCPFGSRYRGAPVVRSLNYQLNYEGGGGSNGGRALPAPLTIAGISPCSHLEDDYFRRVISRVVAQGGRDDIAGKHHNNIGLALLLSYGETQVVLGADLEEKAWAEVIEDRTRPGSVKLHGQLIKASHHGSKHGFSNAWWSGMQRHDQQPDLVIVTHFTCGENPPPHREALDSMAATGAVIGIPFAECATEAVRGLRRLPWSDVSAEEVMLGSRPNSLIQEELVKGRVRGSPSKGRGTWGMISAYFDHTGTRTRLLATPSAGFFAAL